MTFDDHNDPIKSVFVISFSDEGKEQLARDNQLRMALQVVKSLPKMREIQN